MNKLIISLVLLFAFMNIGFADKYKNGIDSNTQSLKEIQKSIKEKKLEKEKCLLDEKCIRKELKRIEWELAKIEQDGRTLKKKIKEAEIGRAHV